MDHILHSSANDSSDRKSHEKPKEVPAQQDIMFDNTAVGEVAELDERTRADLEKQKAAEGNAHFHRLGWKRLTVVLIVEAIALGCLSLPSAFATLGMVAGTILCVGLGLVAIYTSYVVGQVKLAYPHVSHYADAGQLMMGKFGYELVGVMFSLQLIFLVGSHCLTGTIAFLNLTDNGACSVVFGVVSAIILLIIAIPPSFAEVAILGYIDFVSIALAVGITIIATGIKAGDAPGGLSSVDWSAWPKDNLTFTEAFIAITNIVFAYSFAVCQFSFMDEMHTPQDFVKSIWALGLIEIAIYTLTGALIYAFVGSEVKSPALLSAGDLISKVAFGIALPVIFISGSINTTVVSRYLHARMFKDSIIRYINTKMGWITWLALITVITVIAFIIAESIPFFSDLLSISSSLFISGFTFYFPAIMWFMLIRKGPWYSKENLPLAIANALIFIIGMIVLVGGTYASIDDIIMQFRDGTVRGVFTCEPIA
ncbi:transmembrane amino acid transporter protein-domain-containing protein [Ilyonectria robusta]|uniref:transmembrane amino acid transporter protein-domain-containing protein n=1 Tax=Ilyonectria robusta TaxID=1079257 RepID=UPI001E8E49A7|nr:transmembrane amino acid transporter protein-domain-containing protein [Ilyonectria robusta]KAH8734088.1 transmembrane amino acid transporter protein-domain-containing protein [Ilyonectria robusta]